MDKNKKKTSKFLEDLLLDMVKKGRSPSGVGENNPNVKLSKDDVLTIRKLHESGKYSNSELADKFNVKYVTVYKIIIRERWNHI